MKEKEQLTKQQIMDLHSAINGTSTPMGGIILRGALQYEDHSEKYSLTVKLMKVIEKIGVEFKAWQHILKTAESDKKEGDEAVKTKKAKTRQEKVNEYLESSSDIIFTETEIIKFSDLDNLKHPEDAKKKLPGELIKYLMPVLNMDK